MLSAKQNILGKYPQYIGWNTRVPRFGPFGSYANVLYRPQAFSPLRFKNNAAWYDVGNLSSMRNNAGAVPSNGEGIKLLSDISGNSSTNVLCLNGAAGNYASAPDSAALSITGDIDVRAQVALNDWTPGGTQGIFGKFITATNQRAYLLTVEPTGVLRLYASTLGSNDNGATSSAAVSFADLATGWIRATRVAATGVVTFFTSTDGTTWAQLGTPQASTSGNIFDSTAPLEIGAYNVGVSGPLSGIVYRAQIYNGINGTLVFDANFATAAKLATSFTESSSNAATVTINTSGATGARISGARDLYQGTAANQPILTIAGAGNYLTFDGSNDWLKCADYAGGTSFSAYYVGSQPTWADTECILDQTVGAATGQIQFRQTAAGGGASPRVALAIAGGTDAPTDSWALNTNAIITTIHNAGTSQSIRYNRTAIVTAAPSALPANGGITLGARWATTAADRNANITASEILIRSVADSTATQDQIIAYEMAKWGIS